MGAPLGNQNAAKGKRWEAALERAFARRATGEPIPTDSSPFMQGIDQAATIFVSQLFEIKELGYFKELADRLDGRAVQGIEGAGGGAILISVSQEHENL